MQVKKIKNSHTRGEKKLKMEILIAIWTDLSIETNDRCFSWLVDLDDRPSTTWPAIVAAVLDLIADKAIQVSWRGHGKSRRTILTLTPTGVKIAAAYLKRSQGIFPIHGFIFERRIGSILTIKRSSVFGLYESMIYLITNFQIKVLKIIVSGPCKSGYIESPKSLTVKIRLIKKEASSPEIVSRMGIVCQREYKKAYGEKRAPHIPWPVGTYLSFSRDFELYRKRIASK
jgi:hypothetical protein